MLFPGMPGVITGAAIMLALWLLIHFKTKKVPKGIGFDFDARNESGAFEKLLPLYVDFAKFVLGLATGSIVLLVGSSALHTAGHLPKPYASPLFLLVISIGCGILCMMWLVTDYEAYRHDPTGNAYTRLKYMRNQLLGYSSVFCFLTGYVWLIVNVTA